MLCSAIKREIEDQLQGVATVEDESIRLRQTSQVPRALLGITFTRSICPFSCFSPPFPPDIPSGRGGARRAHGA